MKVIRRPGDCVRLWDGREVFGGLTTTALASGVVSVLLFISLVCSVSRVPDNCLQGENIRATSSEDERHNAQRAEHDKTFTHYNKSSSLDCMMMLLRCSKSSSRSML